MILPLRPNHTPKVTETSFKNTKLPNTRPHLSPIDCINPILSGSSISLSAKASNETSSDTLKHICMIAREAAIMICF